jgi:DNA excision repair protein ERCC-2
VKIDKTVAETMIIPRVREHAVDEGEEETIKLNFASELSVSGWTDVDAEVVENDIVPIAKGAQKE